MLGLPCHRRDEGDGRGAAADHDDALAGVVVALRPVLGMDDVAAEALAPLEVRGEALVVAVVARARVEEAAGDADGLARVGALDVDQPGAGLAGELGADRAVPVADHRVDSVFRRGLLDVRADRGPVGDRLGLLPGPEPVAEGEHVRVRADPGIAEEVPGAAHRLARLEDGDRLLRAALADLTGGADAGEPGAHDQDVDVLCVWGASVVAHGWVSLGLGNGRRVSQGGRGTGDARDPRRRGKRREGVPADRRSGGRGREARRAPRGLRLDLPSNAWASDAASFSGWDDLWRRMWENSVDVPGPHIDRFIKACAELDVYCAIGVNERESMRSGSLFNTMLLIGPEGFLQTPQADADDAGASLPWRGHRRGPRNRRDRSRSRRRPDLLGEPDAARSVRGLPRRSSDLGGANRRRFRRLARDDAPHGDRVGCLRRLRSPVHPRSAFPDDFPVPLPEDKEAL